MLVPPVMTTIVFLFHNYVLAQFLKQVGLLMLCDITLEIFSYLLDMLLRYHSFPFEDDCTVHTRLWTCENRKQ